VCNVPRNLLNLKHNDAPQSKYELKELQIDWRSALFLFSRAGKATDPGAGENLCALQRGAKAHYVAVATPRFRANSFAGETFLQPRYPLARKNF